MSSMLARSAVRVVRHAPRTRIPVARTSTQLRSLHFSPRRWEELKSAAVQARDVTSTTGSATNSGATQPATPTSEVEEVRISQSFDAPAEEELSSTHAEPTASQTNLDAKTSSSQHDAGSSVASSEPAPAETAAEVPPLPPLDAWKRAGVHPDVAERLVSAFPDITAPTPAQLAYLLTIQRGNADVYLKDDMGRGKTFATVLAALSLGLGGEKVLILVPTPHLLRQVEDLLSRLSPDASLWTSIDSPESAPSSTAAVTVTTPKLYQQSRAKVFPSWILVDEPEAMLGPLPPRHTDLARLAHHPLFKHPPPVIEVLNRLFGIRPARRLDPKTGKYKRPEPGRIDMDMTRRRDIRSAWTSASLQAKTKSFVYRRGWARGAADLNWAPGASERQMEIRGDMERIGGALGGVTVEKRTRRPDHFAIEVGPTGRMAPILPPAEDSEKASEEREAADDDGEGEGEVNADGVSTEGAARSPVFAEAVALLQTLSPPPPGTYALVLPPQGQSLHALADQLSDLGIPCAPLVPEAIAAGVPPPEEDGPAPVLIASRESLTGLHLPDLHTVYLVNGVDVGSLSANQRKFGGRGERLATYARVAGRLGRLGTRRLGKSQRVVSLLPQEGRERDALLAAVRDMGETLDEWRDVDLEKL